MENGLEGLTAFTDTQTLMYRRTAAPLPTVEAADVIVDRQS